MKKLTNWLIAFSGAMIMAWLGNYFYDSTKHIPILKYITGVLNWLYDSAIYLLTFKIAIWVELLVLATIIGILYLYTKLKTPKEVPPPDFTKYTKDVFKSWIWRWDWKQTEKGWVVKNLIPYCPNDDVQLIEYGNFLRREYYCPKCEARYDAFRNPVESLADAEVLILDKVSKKTYPKE